MGLNIFQKQEWINVYLLCNQVVFLQVREFKETVLKSLLESHSVEAISGLFDCVVELIFKDLIPEVVVSLIVEVKTLSRNVLLNFFANPFLKNVKSQDGRVCDQFIEVSIFQRVTCIGECDTSGINSVHFDALADCSKVTL